MKILTLIPLLMLALNVYAQMPEQFKTDDGETLYFTRSGSGPRVIVLCGGPGFGAHLIRPWLDSLSTQCETVLFEQRGTGLSKNVRLDSTTINVQRACQDIDNLREYFRDNSVALVGYSWGGMLALAYVARYPEHVHNVVLLAPGPGGVDLTALAAFRDNIRRDTYPSERDSIAYWGRPENRLQDTARADLLQLVFSLMNRFYDHTLGRRVAEERFKNADFNSSMSDLMWKDVVKGFDIKVAIKEYRGRCSIIRPRQDVVPEEVTWRIKETIPQARLYYMERCGHAADLEKPNELFPLLRSVLRAETE